MPTSKSRPDNEDASKKLAQAAQLPPPEPARHFSFDVNDPQGQRLLKAIADALCVLDQMDLDEMYAKQAAASVEFSEIAVAPLELSDQHCIMLHSLVRRMYKNSSISVRAILTALAEKFCVSSYLDIHDQRWPEVRRWLLAQ